MRECASLSWTYDRNGQLVRGTGGRRKRTTSKPLHSHLVLVAVCLHRYCTPALTFNDQVSQSRWCTPSFAHVGPFPDSGSGLSNLGLCSNGQALYPRYHSPRCGKRALSCGAWLPIPTRAICGVPITAKGTSSPTGLRRRFAAKTRTARVFRSLRRRPMPAAVRGCEGRRSGR